MTFQILLLLYEKKLIFDELDRHHVVETNHRFENIYPPR
jgi:hypothetical protein